MSAAVDRLVEVMRDVQKDCEADAKALDSTPFTPRGIGETFGATLAMVAAVARAVEVLAAEVAVSPPDEEPT